MYRGSSKVNCNQCKSIGALNSRLELQLLLQKSWICCLDIFFPKNPNVQKDLLGLRLWAPGLLIGPGANEKVQTSTHEHFFFDEYVQYLTAAGLREFIVPNSLFFLLTNIRNYFLKIVFEFWDLQLTSDAYN